MKIGWTLTMGPSQASVTHLARTLMDVLGREHALVHLPSGFLFQPKDQQLAAALAFVRESDVILGLPGPFVLAARQQLQRRVPGIFFMMGAMPRGAFGFTAVGRFFNSGDTLIGNCQSEMELTAKFVQNARARVLGYPYDHRTFHPLDEQTRSAARAKLALGARDRVVLYAGRITLEKNLQTVLRVFRATLDSVPEAVLLIAGAAEQTPFLEFGAHPVNLGRGLERLVGKLGIPATKVKFLGPMGPDQLRALYNIADVAVNMTLHHDEDFGLAQVEAMACGTPVVGTNWGGLKDTIVDGVTGYKVSAVVTPLGVKVDWWEAVNRIVQILRDPAARERFRQTCPESARERYSLDCFVRRITSILTESVAEQRIAEPLQVTRFAQEFWTVCSPEVDPRPSYRRGPRSRELYQELIAPFSGGTAEHLCADTPMMQDEIVTLAAPATVHDRKTLRVHDPIYPLDVEIPDAHLEAVAATLTFVRARPATTRGRVQSALSGLPAADDALAWMFGQGVLLRTKPVAGWLDPSAINPGLGEHTLGMQEIAPATDVMIRQ